MADLSPLKTSPMEDLIYQLTNEVNVLRESVDDLKTSLDWAVRNARLTIQFTEANHEAGVDYEIAPLPPVELFEIGDGVTFEFGDEEFDGEVIELDDGGGVAKILLSDTLEQRWVSQQRLVRIQNDPLAYRDLSTDGYGPKRDNAFIEKARPPPKKQPNEAVPDVIHPAPGFLF